MGIKDERVPLCLCANYGDNHKEDCPVMRHIDKYDAELDKVDNTISELWKVVDGELNSPDRDLNDKILQAALTAIRRLTAVAC